MPVIMIVKSNVFSTVTNLTLTLMTHRTIPPLLQFLNPILLLLPPHLPKPFYNASPQSPKLFSTNYSKNVLVIYIDPNDDSSEPLPNLFQKNNIMISP
jgi:hypothetical protein